MDNPLLREPLGASQVKPRPLGHWGTTPGLNFVCVRMNRVIRVIRTRSTCWVQGMAARLRSRTPTWKAPTARFYSHVSRDEAGLRELFRQFSFPGGIPSYVAPETPWVIHAGGGELGYALAHAYGGVFDNPDLLVCCMVGDGEAETGPLATGWHSNKFLSPVGDGAVLPILASTVGLAIL